MLGITIADKVREANERVRSMKQAGEVIVLIGAGASQSLGIPAMGGMFDAFLRQPRATTSPDVRRICQMFVDKLGVDRDLEEFLLAVNTIVDTRSQSVWKLVEKTISPSMKGSRVEKHRTKLQEYMSEVKKARGQILDFMAKTCFQFKHEEARSMLTGFVRAAALKGFPVYTTNYDFALEYTAEENDITVHDNFVTKGRRQIWNPDIKYPLGEGLTIVKLHGSVTWYQEDNGTIEKIDSYTIFNRAGQSVERLVVFPTRFKDIYEQHFFALYSHFLASLSSAKCLVVIGHSLRDEYLRAGIIERFRRKDLRLVVIDPLWPEVLPVEFKPAKIGTAGALTHIPYKFEEFSNELAHVLENESPINVGKACVASLRQMRFKKSKVKLKGNIGILRPGEIKTFSAAVDAYVHPHHRPVCIRAWLEARFQAPSGEQKHEVMRSFLNSGNDSLSLGLSGALRVEIPLKVKIPKYPEWLERAEKVTLRIALLEKSQRGPMSLKDAAIIAEDARDLTYSA